MKQMPLRAKGSFSLLVQPEHLADRFKDAILPPVFATPVIIMVMENAALNAIRAYLDPGESAVGTAVNVRHLAATSVRRLVIEEAEVTKVDGRQIEFAVRATEGTNIPVTVKFRIGIDDEHHTHLDAGRIAEAEGAAAVALHARTAAQRYSGTADWEQIARLKQQVRTIPVLGNGDIYDASDALAMMASTGCDGVVIGRGCLGRPWLFAELSSAFTGSPSPIPPTLGEVADVVRRHGQLLAAHFGEDKGMRDIRKHIAWYLHGFPAGSELRRALAMVKTLDELDSLLDRLDRDVPFPDAATGPRGRQGSPARVALPDGWLTDPDDCTVPAGADVMHSGG